MFSPNEAPDALCPKCGGCLRSTIVEEYNGIPLQIKADGSWVYDSFDGTITASYVAGVGCEDCDFSTEQPEQLRRQLAGETTDAGPSEEAVDSDAEQVWVLHISHKHGHDYTVCKTEERMWLELYAYVKRWWSEELPDQDMPDDQKTAISQYFGEMGDRLDGEYYYTSQSELLSEGA